MRVLALDAPTCCTPPKAFPKIYKQKVDKSIVHILLKRDIDIYR